MRLNCSMTRGLLTGAAAFVCASALTGPLMVEPAWAEAISDSGDVNAPADALEVTSDQEASSADSPDLNDSASVLAAPPEALAVLTGWQPEGGSYVYYYPDGGRATGWLVTAETPTGSSVGLERYWLGSDGVLVRGEQIDVGDGTHAYAKPDGTVVRGKWVDPSTGYVYLANNDGVLESPGWHVTDAYGDGLQRYWIDPKSHACVPGESEPNVSGADDYYDHWTTSEGYVYRTGFVDSAGGKRFADNDGRLLESGWLVTGDFTGGTLERYWFEGGSAVTEKLVKTGASYAYARPDGSVVRGKWVNPSTGYVYLADNDGSLVPEGWVVSDAYGDGLQRYYIEGGDVQAAVPGRSSSGWEHYTTPAGYVLRSAGLDGDGDRIYADNDGEIVTDGWVVTDGWGQGLQRYWLEGGVVVSGRLVDAGADGHAYAQPDGTILRGKLVVDGVMLLADNDGRLAWGSEGWMVAGDYDGGQLQRYYLTRSSGGYFGARLGRFAVGNVEYYGREDVGYVVRGGWTSPSGEYLWADNEGILGHVIMGSSLNTVNQMVGYYNAQLKAYPSVALGEGGAPDIRTFCTILCEEAAAEGVRAEIVFTQAMLETGWLQFGGDVKVDQFNFAGIGATGGGVPGNSFPDVRTGIRAQVQHLKAYASTEPLNNPCVDPRFHYVTRGSAPTMEQLSGKWATGSGYGQSLARILTGLSSY